MVRICDEMAEADFALVNTLIFFMSLPALYNLHDYLHFPLLLTALLCVLELFLLSGFVTNAV